MTVQSPEAFAPSDYPAASIDTASIAPPRKPDNVVQLVRPAPSPDPKTIVVPGTEKRGESGDPLPTAEGPDPLLPLLNTENIENVPQADPRPNPSIGPQASTAGPVGSFTAEGVFIPAPKSNVVIAALKANGLYISSLGAGRHSMTCPWASDHEAEAIGETIYCEPDDYAPYGRFQCSHHHTEKSTLVDLLSRLDIDPQRARGKPCIRIEAGEQNLVQAAAEYVLASRPGIFQSNGAIVAVRGMTGEGDLGVELVNDQMLTLALSSAADWEKYDGRSKAQVRCDPPVRVCQMLAKGQEYQFLRDLKGIARQPFFRRGDGVLVEQPGFDSASGIYARFDPQAYLLPEPTKDAAEQALIRLLNLIGEFHFATEIDRSASVCAMLTATVRATLPLAPAFNITAASSGSGKSYLSSVITPFAGPGSPFNMSYPTTSEEASKAMLAALIQAPAVIAFDDMQTDWLPHGVMNRMLTSETIADRVLGASKVITARTASFILGTGNNVSPVRDMCRRVVSIRLAPPSAAPSMLKYAGNPVEAVRRKREAFVVDALTIIRSWQAAGMPKADVPSIGSFGEWSDMCRQPLLWLGQPDPATSLMDQVTNDPDTRALAAFMEAWTYEFGTQPVTVRKVARTVRESLHSTFADAAMELPICERDGINTNKLGWFLKKNAERIVDGHLIRKVDMPERRAWTIVKVEGPPLPLLSGTNPEISSVDPEDKF